MPQLTLSLLPERLSVARLEPDAALPDGFGHGAFCSVTRTSDEVSVVAPESVVPEDWRREDGWRALSVDGPLDFDLVGVLASLLAPLASAGVPVFVVSTFDTDHVLVRDARLDDALAALRESGHVVAD